MIERRGAPDIILEIGVQPRLEGFILPVPGVSRRELFQGRDQQFGDKAAPVGPEMSRRIREMTVINR